MEMGQNILCLGSKCRRAKQLSSWRFVWHSYVKKSMQCLCHMPLATQTFSQAAKVLLPRKQKQIIISLKVEKEQKPLKEGRNEEQPSHWWLCLFAKAEKLKGEDVWGREADVTRWKKLYIPLIIISSAATLKNHRWHVEDRSKRSRSCSLLWLVRDELQWNVPMIEWRLEEPETALCMLRCTFIDWQ